MSKAPTLAARSLCVMLAALALTACDEVVEFGEKVFTVDHPTTVVSGMPQTSFGPFTDVAHGLVGESAVPTRAQSLLLTN